MKLKKPIASLVSVVLLTLGMATLVTSPASAHTNAVSATCSALSVDLRYYQASQAGQEATYKTVHHEAVTHTVHHAAVTHTEWKYSKHGGNGFIWLGNDTFKYVDKDGAEWTSIAQGWRYERTQDTRTVTDKDAWDEVVVDKPAWDEQVVDHPAVPAKTNHVVVTIDGTAVEDTDFSTTFTKSYTFSDKYTSHTYSVVVTAWDDPKGHYGWTFTKSGSSIACRPPVVQVTADFPDPIAPTCTTDGSLPSLPTDQTGITFSWDKKNPLKMVAKADKGYILTGVKFRIYEEPGKATGDCYVTPGTVTVAPATCQVGDGGVAEITGGSITLPTTAGITYTITTAGGDPVTVTDGKATGLAAGDYTVTATPAEGMILTVGETDWVLQEDGTATLTMTVAAAADCSIPQPDPQVAMTEWVDGTWACDDTTVEQTREVTTTPYAWVDGAWVLDIKSASTVTETQTRDLLPSEQTVCSQVLAAPPNTVVTIVPPTCTADGSATLANGVGYTWDKTSFGPGTWTATATVTDGYVFDSGDTYQVTFTVAPKLTGSACTVSEVLAAPPNASVPTAAVLAATGATPLPLGIVAMVMIGAGVLLQPRVRRAVFSRH